MRDRLMIVRHGPGRGRNYEYNEIFLRFVEGHRPDAYERLRLHMTGQPRPSLDGVRTVLFWVGDPLKELYPEDYRECAAIAAEAVDRGLRVVNDPDALSNTIRARQSRILSEAGALTPSWMHFGDRVGFERAAQQAGFPAFVRAELHHSQEGMRLCGTREEALSLPDEDLRFPGVLGPYVDVREGYRDRKPGSPWADYFHKKRAVVFGDRVLLWHVFFAPKPIVCWGTCVFGGWNRRIKLRRRILGPSRAVRRTVAAEAEYLRGETDENAELMLQCVRALGLDFAALDYSTFVDGRHIIWEVNPYPVLGTAVVNRYSKLRSSATKKRTYMDALTDWLVRLADGIPESGRVQVVTLGG